MFAPHFTEVRSLLFDWQEVIVLNIRLAPNGRRAIIWTNDGIVYWHLYGSPGLDA